MVEEFTVLQIIAPILLVMETRLRIPISTSILLRGVFSSSNNFFSVIEESLVGYVCSFMLALIV